MKHRLIFCFFILLFTVHLNAEYIFYQGWDSPGGDMAILTNTTKSQKEVYCNSRVDCQGFNTKGNIKNFLLPDSEWTDWSSDPKEGLYRKITDFVFTQGLDSPGSEIANLAGETVPALKVYCHEHPECVGFNTQGSIKGSTGPQSQWVRFSDDPKAGFYMIKGYVPQAPTLDGYNFAQQLDSSPGNISQVPNQTPAQLKAICDADSTCLGFNTDGWLKNSLRFKSDWVSFGTNTSQGLYYKKGYSPSATPYTYTTYQGQDSISNDISYLPDRTPDQVKAFCDDTPSCVAYNSAGFVKSAVKDPSQFNSNPNSVLYIKDVPQNLTGYNFAKQMDSNPGNMRQVLNQKPAQLKAICDADPTCLGFNTDGWLKNSLRFKSDWVSFGTSTAQGLYYKKGYSPATTSYSYTSSDKRDSLSNDITYLPDRTPDQVKAFCDDTPSCVAYNSAGFAKYAVGNVAQLSFNPNSTLYIKNTNIAPTLKGYYFAQQYDSSPGDMRQVPNQTPTQLKAICDADPTCLGFNTMGWLKNSLRFKNDWNWIGGGSTQGLYYKQGYSPSATPYAYAIYTGRDSSSNDITFLPDRTPDQIKAFCDDTPSCVGYNSAGFVKYALKSPGQYDYNPSSTLFVKAYRITSGQTLVTKEHLSSGDLKQLDDQPLAQLKTDCDGSPNCMEANTGGDLNKVTSLASTSFNHQTPTTAEPDVRLRLHNNIKRSHSKKKHQKTIAA